MTRILTTENTSLISDINSIYFNDSLDLSQYGNLANITQFSDNYSGIINIPIDVVNSDNIILVLFDNLTLKKIKVKEGINQIYAQINSNNWGFLLFPINPDMTIPSTIVIPDINSIYTPPEPITYSTIGNVTVDIFNRKAILNTGSESVSILSTQLFDDRNYLKNSVLPFLPNKGSALMIDNLSTGVYKFNVSLGKYDKSQNDSLFLYNGKSFSSLSNINELVSDEDNKFVEFEVVYGFIYLIALDAVKSNGLTEFIITDVSKISELNYIPIVPISLIPHEFLGRVIATKNQTIISTGTGSKTIKEVLSHFNLPTDFTFASSDGKTFTEGSYALWNLSNGEYKINWKFTTKESEIDGNKDSIYIYDGQQFTLLNNSVQNNESLIEVTNGKLIIFVLDEKNKKGTTEIIITNIQQLLHPQPQPNPEPNPNPDNLRVNNGENEQINFRLGGDIVNHKIKLNLSENKQINFTTDNLVIWEFIQNNAVLYSQEYMNEIYAHLLAGEYELSLSTESSIETDIILNLSFGEAVNPIPDTYLVIGEQ